MKHEKTGFEDRNLLLGKSSGQEAGELDETQVSPDEVAGLRGVPVVPEERFAVVLIGKEVGEKHRSYTPFSSRDVFDRIDAAHASERDTTERLGVERFG